MILKKMGWVYQGLQMHKVGKSKKINKEFDRKILGKVVIAIESQDNNLNYKDWGKNPKKSWSVDREIIYINRWRVNTDNNGELNLSAIAIKPGRFQQKTTTERQSESNAWGQNDRSSKDGNIKEQVVWMKQESCLLN